MIHLTFKQAVKVAQDLGIKQNFQKVSFHDLMREIAHTALNANERI